MRSAAWARSPRRWPKRRARPASRSSLDAPVEEMIVERGRAAGVVAGGKTYRAKAVVAGVHPEAAVHRAAARRRGRRETPTRRMAHWASESGDLPDERRSCPSCRASPACPSPATISPPASSSRRRWPIWTAPISPRGPRACRSEPIVEMLIPSTLDDSLAPPGSHVASLFCQHFPYEVDGRLGRAPRRGGGPDHRPCRSLRAGLQSAR